MLLLMVLHVFNELFFTDILLFGFLVQIEMNALE